MVKSKNLTEVGLPKEFCRWNEERGCWEVHFSICDMHPHNPRNAKEYLTHYKGPSFEKTGKLTENAAQVRLMSSMDAGEEWGGIHELCKGFVEGERLTMLVGHRRRSASINLYNKYKDDDPDKAEGFSWLPMDIVDAPESELNILLHMQSSNNLQEGWSFIEHLTFVRTLFATAKREGYDVSDDDVVEELGSAIGWAEGRLPVMVAVSQSKVLMSAVQEYDHCTYKTWRSVVHICQILLNRRFDDVIYELAKERGLSVPRRKSSKLHGAPDRPKKSDKKMVEFVYKLLVDKVDYYARNRKCQVGAVLERIKKPLRNGKFPAVRIQRWLTADIDMTPNLPISLERETDGSRRNAIEAKFVFVVTEELTKAQLIKAGDADISDRMSTVTYNAAQGICESGNVKAKAHTRTRRNKDSRTGVKVVSDRISHTVSIPGASKRAYGLLRQQLEPILTDPQLLSLCTETQRSLLQSAHRIIQQG